MILVGLRQLERVSKYWKDFVYPCSNLTMFVQEFEAADYLALHLPWDLEIFTKDVDIHHLKT